MKKSILMIIIGLVGITLSLAYKNIIYKEEINTPDSGWDYDYDSGSSWDSGSSYDYDSGSSYDYDSGSSYDHDYDYDYDYHSSSSSSCTGDDCKSTTVDRIIMAIVFIIMFVVFPIGFIIYVYKSRHYTNKNSGQMSYEQQQIWNQIQEQMNNNREAYNESVRRKKEEFTNILGNYGISYDYVIERAFQIYAEVQYAWMNFDLNTLRRDLSDELYNEYAIQLEKLRAEGKQNIMSDISKIYVALYNVTENNNVLTLDFSIKVSQKDYVVNMNDSHTPIRGDLNNHDVLYDIRYTITPYQDNYCPNCGNKLNNNASTICPYCGAVVVNKNHDLVMVKKQVTRQ